MAPYCLAKPLFLCPLRSPESTKLKPAKRAASNASKEAGNSPITLAPRENFQLDKKLLKLKSRVSFRSALSQSFEGLLVPRSIINSGGRRTGMSGDPLRDLDCAPEFMYSVTPVARKP